MSDVAMWIGWCVMGVAALAVMGLAAMIVALIVSQVGKMIAYKALADRAGIWKEGVSAKGKLRVVWILAIRQQDFREFWHDAGDGMKWQLYYRHPFDWKVSKRGES